MLALAFVFAFSSTAPQALSDTGRVHTDSLATDSPGLPADGGSLEGDEPSHEPDDEARERMADRFEVLGSSTQRRVEEVGIHVSLVVAQSHQEACEHTDRDQADPQFRTTGPAYETA